MSNKKILLIEDNLEMRENTSEILELANYEVHTAENGKKGIALARELMPDLIVCDVMMPEMDGYGVLHMLGKNPETAQIPFIFLTAKAEKTDMRKGMGLGADDYLTKPFDDVELLEAIEVRLKKKDNLITTVKQQLAALPADASDHKTLEELQKIAELNNRKSFKKKQVLFNEGDYPKGLLYVVSGLIKLVKINDDGKELITTVKKAGDFIGFIELMEERFYNVSAIALEDTEICTVSKQDYHLLISQHPGVMLKFVKILSQLLDENEEKMMEMAYGTVRKRVADALVRLHQKYTDQTRVADNTFAISRDDLAAMIGTATETVIRSLSSLKEDGFIEVKGSKITIPDVHKLSLVRY